MIDFNTMQETAIHNFYDGEGDMIAKMFTDAENRIINGKLPVGASIGLHCHETSSEIIFILAGRGKAILDGTDEILTVGTCHYCQKGQTHTLINIGDEELVFYAVVPQQ